MDVTMATKFGPKLASALIHSTQWYSEVDWSISVKYIKWQLSSYI